MTDTTTAPRAVPATFAAPDPAYLARELAEAEAALAALDKTAPDKSAGDYYRKALPLKRAIEECQPLTADDEAGLLRRAEAEVGTQGAYVEKGLAGRWQKAHDADPIGAGTLEAWRARVAAAYRPRFEQEWAAEVASWRDLLRSKRDREARDNPTGEALVRQLAQAEDDLARLPDREDYAERQVRLARLGYHPPAGLDRPHGPRRPPPGAV
jgi:hypothetical protein